MANLLITRCNPAIDAVFETSGIRGMARWRVKSAA